MAGIELVRDKASGEGFAGADMIGAKVCAAMRANGLFKAELGSKGIRSVFLNK